MVPLPDESGAEIQELKLWSTQRPDEQRCGLLASVCRMRRGLKVRVRCHMLLIYWDMGWLRGWRDWTPWWKLMIILHHAVTLPKARSIGRDWRSHVSVGGTRHGAHAFMRSAVDVGRFAGHGGLAGRSRRLPAGDGSLLGQEVCELAGDPRVEGVGVFPG